MAGAIRQNTLPLVRSADDNASRGERCQLNVMGAVSIELQLATRPNKLPFGAILNRSRPAGPNVGGLTNQPAERAIVWYPASPQTLLERETE